MNTFPFNALGLSHKFMTENLKTGDFCIDGTAGRGRDTLFLSKIVGESGKVFAFDIQEEAVKSTELLLSENNVKNAKVFLSCHSKMADFAAKESVDGIMFNFGYLPGGDRNLFSTPQSSLPAIKAALSLLKKDGVMTLCLYYGKENGMEEKDTILSFLETLPQDRYSVLTCRFVNRASCPPIAVLIKKEQSDLK